MRNYVAIFAVIVFVLTFLGSEASAGGSCNNKLNQCIKEKNRKCPVVVGPSKDAFKKNLPQDFCNSRKGDGKLRQANGTQILTGVCSNTPQGEIPKVENMPSTLIISPFDGQKFKRNKPFTVTTITKNLQLGFFSDAVNNYNTFPQKLNKKGIIQGHQHITIQYLGKDRNSLEFPSALEFAFFKGLNDPSKNGKLSVSVDDGLKRPGIYRCCTIISSFSHQPVVLPKAQRGASDDCVRFQVI
uniref:Protein QN1 n=1 Tax=Anthurium amnicola TaxID=1678845 RepID=A0A1D1XW23_9ARAE